MKKVKEIKKWIELYNEMHTACEELQLTYDFYKEELSTEQEVDQAYATSLELVENLELKNMLRLEEDRLVGSNVDFLAVHRFTPPSRCARTQDPS